MISNLFFLNRCFDKNRLKAIISWSLTHCGEKATIELVENLKDLGFQYATQAGISLGLDDLRTSPTKSWLVSQAEIQIHSTQIDYQKGDLTAVEKFQQLIDTWHRTSETLKQNVVQHFRSTDILNPVYMMAFSGARGNISQVRQLVGMRGLMADPQGQIIDFPIRSNFREGLTLTEYVISCYGARKGLVDTALRTANSGYLTRRLVDVSQHVIVSQLDCKTRRGIYLSEMKEGQKTILSLQNRLIGRVLAENLDLSLPSNSFSSCGKETLLISSNLTKEKNFKDRQKDSEASNLNNLKLLKSIGPLGTLGTLGPLAVSYKAKAKREALLSQNETQQFLSDEKLSSSLQNCIDTLEKQEQSYKTNNFVLKNEEISSNLAAKIVKLKKKVLVRSPLTCESKNSICQLCYGWSLAHGNLVSLGEAVGILAAQSIGEPGTQLTMRTFHTGGVFSGDVMDEIRAPFEGIVEYSEALQGTLIRTPHGKIAFLTKVEGEILFKPFRNPKQFLLKEKKILKTRREFSSKRKKKKIIKFKIPPSTILFVREGELVVEKQLIAEFSLMSMQTNQRIQAKHNLNSEIEGQVFFENVFLGVKIGKDGDVTRTAKKLGSIWIVEGKLFQSMVPSVFFPKSGDLVDTRSIINQSTIFVSSNGFIETNLKNKKGYTNDSTCFVSKQRKHFFYNIIPKKFAISFQTELKYLGQAIKESSVFHDEKFKNRVFSVSSKIKRKPLVMLGSGSLKKNEKLEELSSSLSFNKKNLQEYSSNEHFFSDAKDIFFNYPLFALTLKNIRYKKYGYFLSSCSIKQATLKKSTLFSKKKIRKYEPIFNKVQTFSKYDQFYLSNSIEHEFKDLNQMKQFLYLQWFQEKYKTQTGGFVIFDKFHLNENLTEGQFFWVAQENYKFNPQKIVFTKNFNSKKNLTSLNSDSWKSLWFKANQTNEDWQKGSIKKNFNLNKAIVQEKFNQRKLKEENEVNQQQFFSKKTRIWNSEKNYLYKRKKLSNKWIKKNIPTISKLNFQGKSVRFYTKFNGWAEIKNLDTAFLVKTVDFLSLQFLKSSLNLNNLDLFFLKRFLSESLVDFQLIKSRELLDSTEMFDFFGTPMNFFSLKKNRNKAPVLINDSNRVLQAFRSLKKNQKQGFVEKQNFSFEEIKQEDILIFLNEVSSLFFKRKKLLSQTNLSSLAFKMRMKSKKPTLEPFALVLASFTKDKQQFLSDEKFYSTQVNFFLDEHDNQFNALKKKQENINKAYCQNPSIISNLQQSLLREKKNTRFYRKLFFYLINSTTKVKQTIFHQTDQRIVNWKNPRLFKPTFDVFHDMKKLLPSTLLAFFRSLSFYEKSGKINHDKKQISLQIKGSREVAREDSKKIVKNLVGFFSFTWVRTKQKELDSSQKPFTKKDYFSSQSINEPNFFFDKTSSFKNKLYFQKQNLLLGNSKILLNSQVPFIETQISFNLKFFFSLSEQFSLGNFRTRIKKTRKVESSGFLSFKSARPLSPELGPLLYKEICSVEQKSAKEKGESNNLKVFQSTSNQKTFSKLNLGSLNPSRFPSLAYYQSRNFLKTQQNLVTNSRPLKSITTKNICNDFLTKTEKTIKLTIKPGWIYFPKNKKQAIKLNQFFCRPGSHCVDDVLFDQHSIYVECLIITNSQFQSLKKLNEKFKKHIKNLELKETLNFSTIYKKPEIIGSNNIVNGTFDVPEFLFDKNQKIKKALFFYEQVHHFLIKEVVLEKNKARLLKNNDLDDSYLRINSLNNVIDKKKNKTSPFGPLAVSYKARAKREGLFSQSETQQFLSDEKPDSNQIKNLYEFLQTLPQNYSIRNNKTKISKLNNFSLIFFPHQFIDIGKKQYLNTSKIYFIGNSKNRFSKLINLVFTKKNKNTYKSAPLTWFQKEQNFAFGSFLKSQKLGELSSSHNFRFLVSIKTINLDEKKKPFSFINDDTSFFFSKVTKNFIESEFVNKKILNFTLYSSCLTRKFFKPKFFILIRKANQYTLVNSYENKRIFLQTKIQDLNLRYENSRVIYLPWFNKQKATKLVSRFPAIDFQIHSFLRFQTSALSLVANVNIRAFSIQKKYCLKEINLLEIFISFVIPNKFPLKLTKIRLIPQKTYHKVLVETRKPLSLIPPENKDILLLDENFIQIKKPKKQPFVSFNSSYRRFSHFLFHKKSNSEEIKDLRGISTSEHKIFNINVFHSSLCFSAFRKLDNSSFMISELNNKKNPSKGNLTFLGPLAVSYKAKAIPIGREALFSQSETQQFLPDEELYSSQEKIKTTQLLLYSNNWIFKQNPLSLTSFFSPYEGEITTVKTNLFGKQSCLFLTNKDFLTFSTQQKTPCVYVGKLIRQGDQIISNVGATNSGQIIQIDNIKVVLRKAQPILFSSRGVFHVYHGDFVEKNSPLLTLFFQRLKTGDIVQGIPKIEQFFEARQTKEGEILPENLHDQLHELFENYKQHLSPQEATRKALEKIQRILVDGVQKVYESQGVTIAEKHLEVIVRQMTSKVKIIDGGQTGLLRGELIDLDWIEVVNKGIKSQKAEYEPIILGITKAALETESFISASSFQETTRILARAAVERKTDFLKGLKENVILGHLIPAGTGFSLSFDPETSKYSQKNKTENDRFFTNIFRNLEILNKKNKNFS